MNSICPDCGREVEIGEFPFCPHGFVAERNAQAFDPSVVWVSDTDGHFSYPGMANEPCPEGYHPLALTNLRQADRFVTEVNQRERTKAEEQREAYYERLDAQTKQRRDDFDARQRGNLDSRGEALLRAARAYADKRREATRARQRNLEQNFHIQVMSFDSSNRNSYSGPQTGWRQKKS
jgi:hypothetical protein